MINKNSIKILIIIIIIFLIITIGILIFQLLHKNKNKNELFQVEFGSPNESSSSDTSSMKSLLAIGSQANENTKYDTVSTHYLGDIRTEESEEGPPPPPPDPICFNSSEETSNSITTLGVYKSRCCDN